MEILEAAYPVMFQALGRLRADSGGARRMHRGGVGATYEIEVLEGGGAEAFLFGERGTPRAERCRGRPGAPR